MKKLFALLVAFLAVSYAPVEAAQKPIFAVVLTRHGVRSPTHAPSGNYNWPNWQPVADGYLTRHGYTLMTFAGQYYRKSFSDAGLPLQCSQGNVYVYADVDQRTIATGRALIEGICGNPSAVPLNHDATLAAGTKDTLFDNLPNSKDSMAAARSGNGTDAPDFTGLQQILNGRCSSGNCGVIANDPKPLVTGASFAEDLFLEYAQCRPLDEIDPGENFQFVQRLQSAMQLHVQLSNLERYSERIAQQRGGNMFAHIAELLEAKAGQLHPGLNGPDVSNASAAFIVGHDTNIANVAGILGAHWSLGDGYVPNDTPPGGALVFELLRGDDNTMRVGIRFVHQTLAQLRSARSIPSGTVSSPVFFDGCGGVQCSMPLSDFAAIANRLNAGGFVRPNWTESASDPVNLAPLNDPEWTRCD